MELDNEILQYCINKHKQVVEHWSEGVPVEKWKDDNGVQCVRYESGNWWHYKWNNNNVEWW